MASQILRTEDLRKEFGPIHAVDGVDWTLESSETCGIIGPNGAGKTTFFNLVSGKVPPSAGEIYFRDERITGQSMDSVARQGIVKTYQIINIFDSETVFENIRVAAQRSESTYDMLRHHDSLTDVESRAESVVERVGIAEFAETPAASLSYGDKRKLEIGIALACDPKVVLLDEPTSGMGEAETGEVLELLTDLSADPELTIVIIEHDVEFILDFVDRITVFHQGRVLADGPPMSIVDDDDVNRIYLEG